MITGVLPGGVAACEVAGDAPGAALLPQERAVLGNVTSGRCRDFTLGRHCARRALAALGLAAVPIIPGPAREPRWPDGVVGSITHCPGYCAAAVASQASFTAIGIDAEVHDRLPAGVDRKIMLAGERDAVRALTGRGVWFDRLLFSAKESVFKAWFPLTGRWLGFADALIRIYPDPAVVRRGQFRAHLLVPGHVVAGRKLTGFHGRYLVRDGFIVTAVAVPARTRAGQVADGAAAAGTPGSSPSMKFRQS